MWLFHILNNIMKRCGRNRAVFDFSISGYGVTTIQKRQHSRGTLVFQSDRNFITRSLLSPNREQTVSNRLRVKPLLLLRRTCLCGFNGFHVIHSEINVCDLAIKWPLIFAKVIITQVLNGFFARFEGRFCLLSITIFESCTIFHGTFGSFFFRFGRTQTEY